MARLSPFTKTPIGNSYADQVRLSHMRVASVPGATHIQRNYGALPVSSPSGIVPFFRTDSGAAIAPITKARGIARFFSQNQK